MKIWQKLRGAIFDSQPMAANVAECTQRQEVVEFAPVMIRRRRRVNFSYLLTFLDCPL